MTLGLNTLKCFFAQVSLSKPGIDDQQIYWGELALIFTHQTSALSACSLSLDIWCLTTAKPKFFFPVVDKVHHLKVSVELKLYSVSFFVFLPYFLLHWSKTLQRCFVYRYIAARGLPQLMHCRTLNELQCSPGCISVHMDNSKG